MGMTIAPSSGGGAAAGGGFGAGLGGMSGIGMGIGAVGGILQTIAASREAQEMYNQYLQELKRQGKFQDQAMGVVNQNVQQTGSEQAGKDLTQARGEREQMYADIRAVPLSVSPLPQLDLNSARDVAALQMAAQQRAALNSYGDLAHQVALRNTEANRGLNQIENFSQGQSSLFPYRMYRAQNSAWGLDMAGKALSSIGSLSTDMSSFYKQQQPNSAMFGGGFGGGGMNGLGVGNPYGSQQNMYPRYNPATGQIDFFAPGYA